MISIHWWSSEWIWKIGPFVLQTPELIVSDPQRLDIGNQNSLEWPNDGSNGNIPYIAKNVAKFESTFTEQSDPQIDNGPVNDTLQ